MTKEECEIETSKAIMEMINHIAELENENAELKAYNEKLLDGDIEKHNKIVELKAQIEKMKCCGNCEHFNFSEPNYCHKGVYRERQYVCSEWKFGN